MLKGNLRLNSTGEAAVVVAVEDLEEVELDSNREALVMIGEEEVVAAAVAAVAVLVPVEIDSTQEVLVMIEAVVALVEAGLEPVLAVRAIGYVPHATIIILPIVMSVIDVELRNQQVPEEIAVDLTTEEFVVEGKEKKLGQITVGKVEIATEVETETEAGTGVETETGTEKEIEIEIDIEKDRDRYEDARTHT